MALPPALSDQQEESKQQKQNWFHAALRVLLALGIAVFITQLKLDYVEFFLYDMRLRFRPHVETSHNVKLVLIDSATYGITKGPPSATDHEKFLKELIDDGAKVVLYNINNFDKTPGTEKQLRDFATYASTIPNVYYITSELAMHDEEGKLRLKGPMDLMPVASGPLTNDEYSFAKDGVTRRALLTYKDQPMVHPMVAAMVNPDVNQVKNIKGVFEYLETDQVFVDILPAGSFQKHSFGELLKGKFPKGEFKDKVVIVGMDTNLTVEEYVRTPYSRDVNAMTAAEMHANIIDALIRNSNPSRAPLWLNLLIVGLVSILTVKVVFTMKPLQGIIVLASTFLLISFTAYVALWPFRLWVTMAHPALAIFLCYYFFIPYRLIMENRRSWEYYQKNQILSQVEELKTNFISMMSHDLKTPIARIQGMTEVIQHDSTPLSSHQREALDTIKASSDDLLRFISAILQYGRIESANIQLHKENRDVNLIVSDVIKKHEFLAKLKRIQILSELEPMFPIPIDPELMKQVFSNLIENAIKYSPEDTKILVTSEEHNGKVVVQVADQGPGIPADELSNIFMKFFRSKNAKSSPVKGSGLGLYLAKYFTELHRGDLMVESTYGQGSTFTVELPMEDRRPHAESTSRG